MNDDCEHVWGEWIHCLPIFSKRPCLLCGADLVQFKGGGMLVKDGVMTYFTDEHVGL